MPASDQKYADKYKTIINILLEIIKLQVENVSKKGGQNYDNQESRGIHESVN